MANFEKIYLIGNGRVADDCLRIMSKKAIPVEYIEVYSEKFTFTQKLCERLGIPFLKYDKTSIKEFLMCIQKKTLIISAHNSYIFPAKVCKRKNLTIINLHIAYLPEYRGMNPSTWAIYNQEEYAGVTWHVVSSKIDNGAIIVQKKIPIEENESAMTLMLRCFNEGVKLFEENIGSFVSESYTSFVPENANTRLYLGKELPNLGYMDSSWDFFKSYAFLRSMDYSGANLMRLPRVSHDGKDYEITRYKKTIEQKMVDGRMEEWGDDVLTLSWGEYRLVCSLREIKDIIR
jgi:hypothetical protein